MDSDPSDPTVARVDLSSLVTGMEAELRCLLGPAIQLTTAGLAAGGSSPVRVRTEEIVDLLRHLALDAHDAMPRGGQVTIRTGRLREVAECAAIVLHEVPASPVTTGDPRIRKGRSLGLGASYDAVERAGGHFHVSCRGRETVLTICFPLAE